MHAEIQNLEGLIFVYLYPQFVLMQYSSDKKIYELQYI